jgi:hypothetical protein
MHDKGKILFGLAVFLVVITFPIWYNLAMGKASYRPEIVIPKEGSCVEDAAWMRLNHMELLYNWRDEYVRDDSKLYRGKHVKSLSNTCLSCHVDKTTFCDRCHNYAGVDPYCWDCHVITEGVK